MKQFQIDFSDLIKFGGNNRHGNHVLIKMGGDAAYRICIFLIPHHVLLSVCIMRRINQGFPTDSAI